jgi:hypothetical protein
MPPSLAETVRCPLCHGGTTVPLATVRERRYRTCPGCGLAFLDPAQRPTLAEELAEYRLHHNGPHDPGYRRHLARLVAPLLAHLPAGAVGLDYGCGPDPALSTMLAEHGHAVADFDPLFRPDAAALERRYAFIACTEVAEHFHDPAQEFARLAALLEPGGVLAVMTRLLHGGIDFPTWHYLRERSHVVFYRPTTMAWLARRHAWRLALHGPDVALLTAAAAGPIAAALPGSQI